MILRQSTENPTRMEAFIFLGGLCLFLMAIAVLR